MYILEINDEVMEFGNIVHALEQAKRMSDTFILTTPEGHKIKNIG